MKHETPYYDLWQAEKARREELEEELRQIRGVPEDFITPVHLRPAERAYMMALLRSKPGAILTHDYLMDAAESVATREPGNRKITHVIICKLRHIVEPLGVVIETVPWQGYRLPVASRDAWQAAVDRMSAEVAA